MGSESIDASRALLPSRCWRARTWRAEIGQRVVGQDAGATTDS